MVRAGGLEPPWREPHGPEPCTSANSVTPAFAPPWRGFGEAKPAERLYALLYALIRLQTFYLLFYSPGNNLSVENYRFISCPVCCYLRNIREILTIPLFAIIIMPVLSEAEKWTMHYWTG
jgi:hypothetical protein